MQAQEKRKAFGEHCNILIKVKGADEIKEMCVRVCGRER
jgi:hypothetical protein